MKFTNWISARFPWQKVIGKYYLVPKNLNYMYCFGALAVLVLANQLLTGIWLSMFYIPTETQAFASVQLIMRDVNYGWLLRYMHTTGASGLYIVLYLHIFRGLLYGSYQRPRELVWILGMLLFLVLLLESSFGYLLPWGQMSYWSMQVITSLLSIIPYFGEQLAIWARGDYAVSGVTLLRCYALHIIGLPFLILLLSLLHIKALHHVGSNNPLGVNIPKTSSNQNKNFIPFYPFYMLKDLRAFVIFLVLFFLVVFFFPDMGGYFIEVNNYKVASLIQSPEDIRPLWYVMPFYGILKIIPNKALGILLMLGSILVLFFLPWLDKSPVKSIHYKGIYSKFALGFLVMSFIFLGYFSVQELSLFNLLCARAFLITYFACILLMPFYTRFEKCKTPPLEPV
jgi:ubiquinol-cytochrome c reductase cytochrome b subunit